MQNGKSLEGMEEAWNRLASHDAAHPVLKRWAGVSGMRQECSAADEALRDICNRQGFPLPQACRVLSARLLESSLRLGRWARLLMGMDERPPKPGWSVLGLTRAGVHVPNPLSYMFLVRQLYDLREMGEEAKGRLRRLAMTTAEAQLENQQHLVPVVVHRRLAERYLTEVHSGLVSVRSLVHGAAEPLSIEGANLLGFAVRDVLADAVLFRRLSCVAEKTNNQAAAFRSIMAPVVEPAVVHLLDPFAEHLHELEKSVGRASIVVPA